MKLEKSKGRLYLRLQGKKYEYRFGIITKIKNIYKNEIEKMYSPSGKLPVKIFRLLWFAFDIANKKYIKLFDKSKPTP